MFWIPEFQVFTSFEKFNFLTSHTEKDVQDIILLSKMFVDSKINISHLAKNESENAAREKNWEEYVTSKVLNQLEFSVIKESVSDYVRSENLSAKKDFDTFVFTTKKRNFWSRLFDPSTTLSYLAGLEIPCIIFKLEE